MKLLFICELNHQRSPTFEQWFNDHTDHDAKSCGTLWESQVEIDNDLLEWADKVFCMDLKQEMFIKRNHSDFSHKVEVIGVSDEYSRGSPQLISVINFWYENHF